MYVTLWLPKIWYRCESSIFSLLAKTSKTKKQKDHQNKIGLFLGGGGWGVCVYVGKNGINSLLSS